MIQVLAHEASLAPLTVRTAAEYPGGTSGPLRPETMPPLPALRGRPAWHDASLLARPDSTMRAFKPEPPAIETYKHPAAKLEALAWVHVTGAMSSLRAAREDVRLSPNRARTLGAGALYAATKMVGRLNAPGWAMTVATMDVLDTTQSPLMTAAANLAMVGAWSYLATTAIDTGLANYPRAVGTAGDHFSKHAGLVAEMLPGFKPRSEEAAGLTAPARLGALAMTRLMRGLLAQKQLTRYIVTANLSGQTTEQRRWLRRGLSLDAAVVSAAIYGTLSEVMMGLAPHNPALVARMEGDFKNPLTQWTIAGVIVGGNVLRNLISRQKAKTLPRPEQPVAEVAAAAALPEPALEAA